MAKIIESKNCPTCGKPHESGTSQRFEVPELPVVETSKLGALEGKVDSLMTEIKNIKPPEIKLPENLGDVCTEFPALCEQVESLSTKIDKQTEFLSGHPKPVKEALEKVWSDCPECSELWSKWKSEIGSEAATKAVEEFRKKQQDELKVKEARVEEVKSESSFPWIHD